jgi:hypothetical protein
MRVSTKTNRYKVKYTNKKGMKIDRVIKATTGDNAYLTAKIEYKGKNIKVNKLN